MPCLMSFDEDQGEVIPPAIGLFAGIDIKAVAPGGLEDIDAAGFHHGSDPEPGHCFLLRHSLGLCRGWGSGAARAGSRFSLFSFPGLTRSLWLAGGSACAGAGTRWRGCQVDLLHSAGLHRSQGLPGGSGAPGTTEFGIWNRWRKGCTTAR